MSSEDNRPRGHLYHEGYEEKSESIDGGTAFRVKYVYTGNYFKPMMSEKRFILHKIMNVLFALVSFGLQIIGGTSRLLLNSLFIVNSFQTFSLLASILSLAGVIYYATKPQKMEIHYYKRFHKQFPWAYFASWMSTVCIIICSIIGLILFKERQIGQYIPFFIMNAVSCILMFVVWITEKNMQYAAVLPDN